MDGGRFAFYTQSLHKLAARATLRDKLQKQPLQTVLEKLRSGVYFSLKIWGVLDSTTSAEKNNRPIKSGGALAK